MIVLRGRPELAWSRIQERGRAMEVEGGWSYAEIAAMSGYYRSYSEDVRKFGYHDSPILEIDVNKKIKVFLQQEKLEKLSKQYRTICK